VSASAALLVGLICSAEAFPFNWPNPFAQPNYGQHRAVSRTVRAPRRAAAVTTGDQLVANESDKSVARPNEKDKSAKEAPADLAAKAKGLLTIAISLNKQQLTVYSDGMAVARSRISAGYQTPTGVFSIIQKDRWHRSEHGDAPMYYMQRLTWSGVAMHEGTGMTQAGAQTGAQGSIRLPEAFARQLWGVTKVGVRVIITPGDVAPSAIASPRLPGRKPDDAEPENAAQPSKEQSSKEPSSAQVVESAYSALAAAPRTKRRNAPVQGNRVDDAKATDPGLDAMAYAAQEREQATSSDVVKSAYEHYDLSRARRSRAVPTTVGSGEARSLKPGPISVLISRQEGKLFVRKGFEPVFNVPVTIDQPERPLGTHLFTALALNDDDSMRWHVFTLPTASGRPAGRRTGMDLVSVGKPSSAAEALGRVTIPQGAIDRISELMTSGASLIISDQGLGPETGNRTDFTVLTR